MTPIEDRPDALDARFLDRLVDGGLSGPERRDLLLRLDADPEGWRRCALAFLEDQAWRQALGPTFPRASRPPSGSPDAPAGRDSGEPRSPPRSWPRRSPGGLPRGA